MIKSYKDAGVDIEKGDAFASFIGKINSPAISGSIGGFAGGLEIDLSKYKEPVLMSCTDGVGTKLLVAQKLKKYDTVGIDLVAMSVNDLIVCGVEPLNFLDYIACGGINEEILHAIVKGIVDGCEQSECQLSGGETAEMPDLYKGDDFDLAGFCNGIGEKSKILPLKETINSGDFIYGLPSTGVHSNGFSLARKVFDDSDVDAWEKLLVPTKIYVKDMKKLLAPGIIKAAAHITGGGLEGNVQRVFPKHLTGKYSWDWKEPEIFGMIRERGEIEESEMRKVFNLGVGVALVVAADDSAKLEAVAKDNNIELFKIGEVVNA
ncbi:MAG: phosphoribosylformylglycinamidine cyclo-ligase [Spirochaetales bacterium]|nr:phosphoribosylformylglycinamidine cyclo-ligase [Spirochaetales bacterium]